MNVDRALTVAAMGMVANEAHLAALIEEALRDGPTPAGRGRLVEEIRCAVTASTYWPGFCALVAEGAVSAADIAPGPLGACVVGWAHAWVGPGVTS